MGILKTLHVPGASGLQEKLRFSSKPQENEGKIASGYADN